MATILDLYNGSEFSKVGGTSKDSTPISADGKNKLHVDETKLKKARNGQLQEKKYSDTIKK